MRTRPLARRSRRPIQEGSAAGTLDEIESAGDRLVVWLAKNQRLLLAIAAGILLAAGGWGYASTTSQETSSAADAALAAAQNEYRTAMGGQPGEMTIPEPANPEAARQIREEFAALFAQVGQDHLGTGPGAVAFLETGKIQQALGNAPAAIASYTTGLDSLPEADALRGFLWTRLGSVYEADGQWAEAAEVYAKAGALKGYAIRAGASASAIRSYIHAGQPSAALGLADQLQASAPGFVLAESLQAEVAELRYAAAQAD